MKKLVWAVLILAVLYGGYWVVGANVAGHAARGWMADRKAEGWTADYEVMRVQGFPSRFDLRAEGLALVDPVSGYGWKAPVVEFDALAYQPQHYIAVWPHEQTLVTPAGEIAVTSSDMRANLVFDPGPSFVLDRMTLVAADLAVDPGAGLDWGAQAFRFATAQAASMENGHRIGLEVTGLQPVAALRDRIDPEGALPQAIDRLHLDATLGFDARWDRHALEARRPQPTRLRLDDLTAAWGPLRLTLTGDLDIGPDGVPSGTLQITAAQWRRLLDLAFNAGLLPTNNRGMIEGALVFAAASGGGGDDLTAPLTFEDGRMALGALPLGPAPRIVLP